MVRTIVIPEGKHIQLDIPQEYVGKEIEITYLALDELTKKKPKVTMKDLWGILSQETGDAIQEHITKTRSEWERDI